MRFHVWILTNSWKYPKFLKKYLSWFNIMLRRLIFILEFNKNGRDGMPISLVANIQFKSIIAGQSISGLRVNYHNFHLFNTSLQFTSCIRDTSSYNNFFVSSCRWWYHLTRQTFCPHTKRLERLGLLCFAMFKKVGGSTTKNEVLI